MLADGEPDLVWLETVIDMPVALDITLATANLPEAEPPPAQTIEDTRLIQNGGHGLYFLRMCVMVSAPPITMKSGAASKPGNQAGSKRTTTARL